jgi:glycerophosphoryl diester phosphodiesterase
MLYYKLVSRSAIANIKSAGKQVMVWTVNSTKDMKRFASWEVDGIISDSPEELVRTLGRPSPRSITKIKPSDIAEIRRRGLR